MLSKAKNQIAPAAAPNNAAPAKEAPAIGPALCVTLGVGDAAEDKNGSGTGGRAVGWVVVVVVAGGLVAVGGGVGGRVAGGVGVTIDGTRGCCDGVVLTGTGRRAKPANKSPPVYCTPVSLYCSPGEIGAAGADGVAGAGADGTKGAEGAEGTEGAGGALEVGTGSPGFQHFATGIGRSGLR